MVRKTLISAALLAAVIALTDHARAEDMRVISSDATDARAVQLGLNKSVVIELPGDIKNVLIAGGQGGQSAGQHPNAVTVVVLSKRRVSIIGVAVGATNVYFYDADDRQIGALVV